MGPPHLPSTLVMACVKLPDRSVTVWFVVSKVNDPVKIVSLGCVMGSRNVVTTSKTRNLPVPEPAVPVTENAFGEPATSVVPTAPARDQPPEPASSVTPALPPMPTGAPAPAELFVPLPASPRLPAAPATPASSAAFGSVTSLEQAVMSSTTAWIECIENVAFRIANLAFVSGSHSDIKV